MSIINPVEASLLDAGTARRDAFTMLHKSGEADAKRLQRLVGQRCKKFETKYEITRIDYGYHAYPVFTHDR